MCNTMAQVSRISLFLALKSALSKITFDIIKTGAEVRRPRQVLIDNGNNKRNVAVRQRVCSGPRRYYAANGKKSQRAWTYPRTDLIRLAQNS